MAEYSDEELLNLFRNGENPDYAFNLLVRKHQERIYFFVRRMVIDHQDADDIVQNVFIKVWKNLDNFREDSKLFTWMYRIAVNESISFLKARRLRSFLSFDDLEAGMFRSISDDNFFDGDHAMKKLLEAIVTLPSKQKAVFTMRYFDELNYEEMSEIMGTSVGALKASYHFAVKKIAEYVNND